MTYICYEITITLKFRHNEFGRHNISEAASTLATDNYLVQLQHNFDLSMRSQSGDVG